MKVIVVGPRGKMGKLITQVAAEREDMEELITFLDKNQINHGIYGKMSDRGWGDEFD